MSLVLSVSVINYQCEKHFSYGLRMWGCLQMISLIAKPVAEVSVIQVQCSKATKLTNYTAAVL